MHVLVNEMTCLYVGLGSPCDWRLVVMMLGIYEGMIACVDVVGWNS